MDTILSFMAADHDRLDALFRAATPEALAEFRAGLLRHIAWEEDVLFPLFDSQLSARSPGPTAAMRAEHREIKDLLAQLGTDPAAATQLRAVLGAHNEKEEQMLYPAIDAACAPEAVAAAFGRMQRIR